MYEGPVVSRATTDQYLVRSESEVQQEIPTITVEVVVKMVKPGLGPEMNKGLAIYRSLPFSKTLPVTKWKRM